MRNQYNQAKIIKQMLRGDFGKDLGIDVSKANVAEEEGKETASSL